MFIEPRKERNDVLSLIEKILDKGIVINADIVVSVAGVELLGIKLRAALASFETAARYGLAFPSGTDFTAPAWHSMPKKGKLVQVYPQS